VSLEILYYQYLDIALNVFYEKRHLILS